MIGSAERARGADVMKGFDPATSFGSEVAARYDGQPRSDEAAAAAILAGLAARAWAEGKGPLAGGASGWVEFDDAGNVSCGNELALLAGVAGCAPLDVG